MREFFEDQVMTYDLLFLLKACAGWWDKKIWQTLSSTVAPPEIYCAEMRRFDYRKEADYDAFLWAPFIKMPHRHYS